MKRFVIGVTWAFILMWAGNYVALITGYPAPIFTACALGIGGAYVAVPRVRLLRGTFERAMSIAAMPHPAKPTSTDTLARP